MARKIFLAVLLCFFAQASVLAEEKLTIFINKIQFIRLQQSADTIFIGNPDIVSVNLKSPRFLIVTGLKTGTTDLHILGKTGASIFSKELYVVPSVGGTVIVHRGTEQTTKYLCKPDCINLSQTGTNSATPSSTASPTKGIGNIAAIGLK